MEKGPHAAFDLTRSAKGELQFDAWGVKPENDVRIGNSSALSHQEAWTP